MGPIHLMCLLHPGAAAVAVAVVYSVWVVEQHKSDTVRSSKPRDTHSFEQSQQELQRQQQQLTQILKRQQEQQHKRVRNQDQDQHARLSHSPDRQILQGAHVRSSTPQHPEQSAPIQSQLGVIYQRPPLDYDTRIPVLRAHSALPAAARAFVPASIAVRHVPEPPSILQPLQSGLAHRTRPGPPIPYPATTMLSGTGGSSARQLVLKLLATATAVLLGAAAFPATFSTITQRFHNQQQLQQLASLSSDAVPASATDHPASGSNSSSSSRGTGDLAHAHAGDRPAHSTRLGRKQFSLWMQQQLPTVLQQKREELQRLQGLQGAVGSVQDSSRGVLQENCAGGELSVVFGALQGCLREEIDSLQIQVGALETVQQRQ